jgi:pimeloyl-ACP methyl ester carboxylesterase
VAAEANDSEDSRTKSRSTSPSSSKAKSGTKNEGGAAPDDEEPRRIRNVRFFSPLLEYGYKPAVDEAVNGTIAEKPLLLYLPGFDGTYLSPFLQFPELGTVFDIRCMVVPMDDRSTFLELKDTVLTYLRSETVLPLTTKLERKEEDDNVLDGNNSSVTSVAPVLKSRNPLVQMFSRPASGSLPSNGGNPQEPSQPSLARRRPVYLAGESFGGILAVEVATSLLEEEAAQQRKYAPVELKGLALINAATCYDRSRLAALGPAVAEYHPWLYPMGLMLQLLPLFTDEHSFRQLLLILRGGALPSIIDDAAREAYLGRVALLLPFVLPIMTQDALRWRLEQWLAVGCEHVVSQSRLSRLAALLRRPKAFKVLVVAGENDAALPSIAEAERLASVLPNAIVHVVEGAGHASTCGSRVDLAALFRKCYPDDLLLTKNDMKAFESSVSSSSNSVLWQWSSNRALAGRTGENMGRTEMKPVAAAGTNEYLGMEPRYDNATIGLSPLLYWSSKYYRKYAPPVPLPSFSSTSLLSTGDNPRPAAIQVDIAEHDPLTRSIAVSDVVNNETAVVR